MNTKQLDRRGFLGVAGTVAAMGAITAAGAGQAAAPSGTVKILGVACSSRRGMTTAKAVQAALDAAGQVSPVIRTELMDLGGLRFTGWSGNDQPEDDFSPLLAKFRDPDVGGLIIGSPCYFRSMSSVCKAFIERLAPLRSPKMLLAEKALGVVAVGGFRNGGQELVISQIQAAMLCFGMIAVGGHAPAFQGGTLLSANNSIDEDELGLKTAKMTGKHVAEAALRARA
ncbi:MAG: flavodoxin family protein [Verrucomicrobia bacterium]|nr:MAG: flavodoxin family protein [Verrucomicrobiota bacterium]